MTAEQMHVVIDSETGVPLTGELPLDAARECAKGAEHLGHKVRIVEVAR